MENDPNNKERYFSGKWSLEWIVIAASQPGRACGIAVMLLHMATLTKNVEVKVKPSLLRRFRFDRTVAMAAIQRLVDAGLLEWRERKRGSSPIVKLVGHRHREAVPSHEVFPCS
jgi:hypothetical protein